MNILGGGSSQSKDPNREYAREVRGTHSMEPSKVRGEWAAGGSERQGRGGGRQLPQGLSVIVNSLAFNVSKMRSMEKFSRVCLWTVSSVTAGISTNFVHWNTPWPVPGRALRKSTCQENGHWTTWQDFLSHQLASDLSSVFCHVETTLRRTNSISAKASH